MRYEKSCGAVCFHVQKDIIKVLMVQHRLGGHWAFPKGHVEDGETEKETAIREVLEETGVDIEIIDGLRTENTYCPARNITKNVVYFVATATDLKTIAQPEEIRNTDFIEISRAEKSLTYAADKKMLQDSIAFLKSSGVCTDL